MRISDWSSVVCSSDLEAGRKARELGLVPGGASFGTKSAESPVLTIARRRGAGPNDASSTARGQFHVAQHPEVRRDRGPGGGRRHVGHLAGVRRRHAARLRSEEHTSELQSLMRISYAVFCLKKKKRQAITNQDNEQHNTIVTYNYT